MARFAQVGIALGAFGVVIALIGMFPQLIGFTPTFGIGILQVLTILTGYALLLLGAFIFVKFSFYLGKAATLVQQIGVRLAITGLLFAGLVGLADIFGFGSHVRGEDSDIFFGEWQALAFILSFVLSCVGILVYALGGTPEPNE